MKYLNNSPLRSISDDQIGRLHAVEYILNILNIEDLVNEKFYLTAPEGSGRTSTLNFINDCVENKSEVIKTIDKTDDRTRRNIRKHLLKLSKSSITLYKINVDCTAIAPGNSFNFLTKGIFEFVLESPILRRQFLASAGNYRGGSAEYMIERTLFPRLQKEKAVYFSKNIITEPQLRSATSGVQWLLLIDNYDLLDQKGKIDFRNSLTRLHEWCDNIVSVVTVNSEVKNSDYDSLNKKFVTLPSIVGEESEFENFLGSMKKSLGIELREGWGPLLHSNFKDDISGLKTFLNNLLVYPGFDFDGLKVGFFWPLRQLGDLSARKEVHYSRLAAILLVRHKFPGQLEIEYEGDEGAVAFIEDILRDEESSVHDPQDISSFVRGLFNKTNLGLAHPFFVASDAKPYVSLKFVARDLSDIEEKLLWWNQFPDQPNHLLDAADGSSKSSAQVIIESLDVIGQSGGLTVVDKFRLKYWVADASFLTFKELSDARIIDAKFNNREHGLLRDWSNALDTADELIVDAEQELPRFIKEYEKDSAEGSKGSAGNLIAFKGLKDSFDLLRIQTRISRNEFQQARMLINEIRQNLGSEIDEEFINSCERELEEREDELVEFGFRYDLFISHRDTELDNHMAIEIKEALLKINPELKVYLYLHEKKAGELWVEKLWSALNSSRSFLLLTSDSYMEFRDDYRENWTHAESMMARYCSYRKGAFVFWSYLSRRVGMNDLAREEERLVDEFKWLQPSQSLGVQLIEPPTKKTLQSENSYREENSLWERQFQKEVWRKAKDIVKTLADSDVSSEVEVDSHFTRQDYENEGVAAH